MSRINDLIDKIPVDISLYTVAIESENNYALVSSSTDQAQMLASLKYLMGQISKLESDKLFETPSFGEIKDGGFVQFGYDSWINTMYNIPSMRPHLATFIEFIVEINKTRNRYQPLWLNSEVVFGINLAFLLAQEEQYVDLLFAYLLSVEAVGSHTEVGAQMCNNLPKAVEYRLYASILAYTAPDGDMGEVLEESLIDLAGNEDEINLFLQAMAHESKRHLNHFQHSYNRLYEGVARALALVAGVDNYYDYLDDVEDNDGENIYETKAEKFIDKAAEDVLLTANELELV